MELAMFLFTYFYLEFPWSTCTRGDALHLKTLLVTMRHHDKCYSDKSHSGYGSDFAPSYIIKHRRVTLTSKVIMPHWKDIFKENIVPLESWEMA